MSSSVRIQPACFGVAAILLLSGCAGQGTTQTGFLDRYDGMQSTPDHSDDLIFVEPAYVPGHYRQVILDPVAWRPAPDTPARDPAAIEQLKADFLKRDPVPYRLSSRLELSSKVVRVAARSGQIDHLAPELRGIRNSGFRHEDTSRESVRGVHQSGSIPIPILPSVKDTWSLTTEVAAQNGLHIPSQVMVHRISSVRREKIAAVIGHLDDTTMLAVSRAVVVFLGLA